MLGRAFPMRLLIGVVKRWWPQLFRFSAKVHYQNKEETHARSSIFGSLPGTKVQDLHRQGQYPQQLSLYGVLHGDSSAACEAGMGMKPSVRGMLRALSYVERIDDERLPGARTHARKEMTWCVWLTSDRPYERLIQNHWHHRTAAIRAVILSD